MVSTSLSVSLPSQMPIIVPNTIESQQTSIEPSRNVPPPNNPVGDYPDVANVPNIATDVKQSELYADYLTDPYNTNDSVPDPESLEPIPNPLLDKKSLSTVSSPMHSKPIAQFGSSDNLMKPEENSSMFNFSSYFTSAAIIPPGSEILYGDSLLPTREG